MGGPLWKKSQLEDTKKRVLDFRKRTTGEIGSMTSTSGVMMRLQRLDFPECTREALQYIVSSLASQDGTAIPGLSGGPETIIGEICQTFVHFRTVQGVKVLSALQELQLLELLCDCFKAAPEKHRYHLFQLMFGSRGDEQANTLLNKMVSMALSVSCMSVLDCAAIWMQERTCHSSESLLLTSRLVEDYCLLFPDPSNMFHKLPTISPLFVCNFTTAVTAFFTFNSQETVPPLSLLEHITSWVTSDCTLCCESIRQVAIHGTCSSPIPGLLAWCVLGPIVCSHLLGGSPTEKGGGKKGGRGGKLGRESLTQTLRVLSKLHLGVLQSVDFCRSSSLSQCLLSVTDAMCLVTQLSTLLQRVSLPLAGSAGGGGGGGVDTGEEEGEEGVVDMAMERLAQVLQVAKMAGCLMVQRGSMSELAKMAMKHLPNNRLLSMVVAMPTDRQTLRHTPMETS
ncbi:integrator complex subunit 15-like [Babylonia areolata]|uniref:integrator complex subunit 15-like n=1 Tax=Babylonia areolata TaxID=304850 RepID=UPI003FD02B1D